MINKINYALILSGGSGVRFGDALPKQFSQVLGKSILEYCVGGFNNHKLIDKIVVVVNPAFFMLSQQVLTQDKFNKIVCIIDGGQTRAESSFIGLSKILQMEPETSNLNVFIQDAVRPFTKPEVIDRQVFGLQKVNAISLAIPSTDTLYLVGEDNQLLSIPDRNKIFKAQTPQAFNFNTIFNAYAQLTEFERSRQTDDLSVLKLAYPMEEILILEGDVDNVKITHPNDLESFKQIVCKNNL